MYVSWVFFPSCCILCMKYRYSWFIYISLGRFQYLSRLFGCLKKSKDLGMMLKSVAVMTSRLVGCSLGAWRDCHTQLLEQQLAECHSLRQKLWDPLQTQREIFIGLNVISELIPGLLFYALWYEHLKDTYLV